MRSDRDKTPASAPALPIQPSVPQTIAAPTSSIRTLLRPSAAALRSHWRPFVLLQAGALLVVIGFYRSAAIHRACEKLSQWKASTGLFSAAISSAVACAILPAVAKRLVLRSELQRDTRSPRERRGMFIFSLWAFALTGIIVDLQYRAFGVIYGHANDLRTVVCKVLTDQFITTPIWGVPLFPLLLAWRHRGYSFPRLLNDLGWRWYATRALPILLPCWAFWIPMTALIFSLPGALQFCLYIPATAAWTLLMLVIAHDGLATPDSPASSV